MRHSLGVEGHRPDPWGVGRVGGSMAGGPGGPQDRGLCLESGGCPLPTQKPSSPLVRWGFLFSVFLFLPGPGSP